MSLFANLTEATLKKLKQAEEEVNRLSQIVAQSPEDADSWMLLGDKYSYIGNVQESIRCYKKVLEIHPQDIVSVLTSYDRKQIKYQSPVILIF